jgi:hypothetical protein
MPDVTVTVIYDLRRYHGWLLISNDFKIVRAKAERGTTKPIPPATERPVTRRGGRK